MRSMKLVALGALSLLALVGCSAGQPRIYRVAVDDSNLRLISTSSCFRNNQLPTGRSNSTETGFRAEDEWVIWNGISNDKGEQIEYLDLGAQSFKVGDAPTITVGNLIEGTQKTFSALRGVQEPISDSYTHARQTQITVKFDDYSASPVGTIALNAQYACIKNRVGCPGGPEGTPSDLAPPDAASCTTSLSFVARRIEVQQMTAYNNNP